MSDASKIVVVGSDHAGYELKEKICLWLEERGYEVIDVGPSEALSCDYPLFARKAAEIVAEGKAGKGVLVCGTGVGMSMVANRFKKIRAALCATDYHAKMARAHNDANVLCLGARVTGEGLALEILETFLKVEFEGGRHQRRLAIFSE